MADVIDLLSSEDESENEESVGYITSSVTLEPLQKKARLDLTLSDSRKSLLNPEPIKPDVIVLTDEEDDQPKRKNTVTNNNKNISKYEMPVHHPELEQFKGTSENDVIMIDEDVTKENVPPKDDKCGDDDLLVIMEESPFKINGWLKQSAADPLEEENDPLEEENYEASNNNEDQNETDNSHLSGDAEESTSHAEDVSEPVNAKNGKKEDIIMRQELLDFIELCKTSLTCDKMRNILIRKIETMKKVYARASEYLEGDEFLELVQECTRKLNEDKSRAVLLFSEIFQNIREHRDVEGENERALEKLYRTYRKVVAKIKMYEEAEVDFDEEDDSSYIKMQRYRERAAQIYKSIKKKQKEDPHCGRIYYSRLDFDGSSYSEINHAINKTFRDREKNPFPTFSDVNNCIRKCVAEHKTKISENKLESEIRRCFEQLGNLLQRKRKQDLANVHTDYLKDLVTDPASTDKQLNEKLNRHRTEARDKFNKILEKYSQMQNNGNTVNLSEDSDDSKLEDSEGEN